MPLPQIDVFDGEEVRHLVDSLEKMRKELMFILANLDTKNVNGFDGSVINAGTINGKHLHINSDTVFDSGYDPDGLRTEMNTQFNVVDGQIQGKVSTQTFNLLGERVGTTEAEINVIVGKVDLKANSSTVTALETRVNSAEVNINGLNASINLKAEATRVTALESRMNSAEININGLNASISLKAEATTVNALGTRVNSAEININGLNSTISQKVSYTDYTGSTITSLINQDPWAVSIHASKINLYGAVSVLSDISGALGRISSGDIDIYNEIRVGSGIHLRGGGMQGLYFQTYSQIYDSGGYMTIEGFNRIDMIGNVDFSRAQVTGLSSGSTTVRYSSASRRLYVDLYGVEQGYISVP